ncbi:antitoxin MazE-like protein [Fulvimarina sp. MAC3]|uniref:antitoxin MazE-like protein n=1 Tax=Fulvimarina sp. MAC3 TaxID=3148887 RepID=UPI0031FD4079
MGRPKELTEEQRAELRAKGFVPVEIWVPDWDNPEFQQRMKREMEMIAKSDAEDQTIGEWTRQVSGKLWDDIEP